jgi:hypothetical protein
LLLALKLHSLLGRIAPSLYQLTLWLGFAGSEVRGQNPNPEVEIKYLDHFKTTEYGTCFRLDLHLVYVEQEQIE